MGLGPQRGLGPKREASPHKGLDLHMGTIKSQHGCQRRWFGLIVSHRALYANRGLGPHRGGGCRPSLGIDSRGALGPHSGLGPIII